MCPADTSSNSECGLGSQATPFGQCLHGPWGLTYLIMVTSLFLAGAIATVALTSLLLAMSWPCVHIYELAPKGSFTKVSTTRDHYVCRGCGVSYWSYQNPKNVLDVFAACPQGRHLTLKEIPRWWFDFRADCTKGSRPLRS